MICGIGMVVVVAGCQRSGTTLTGQILGAHPDAVLIDETDDLYAWTDAALAGAPEAAERLAGALARAAGSYRAGRQRIVLDDQGAPRLAGNVTHLVLKAPNLTHCYGELARFGRSVRVVFPVRDARAVVASMARLGHIPMVERQLAYLSSVPALRAAHPEALAAIADAAVPIHVRRALVWRIKSLMHERLAGSGVATALLRYEDLVADPRAVTERLATHIGLELHEDMLRHDTVYQGFGPGLTDRTRPVDAASLERWRNALSPAEEADILAVAGDVMRRLGYAL